MSPRFPAALLALAVALTPVSAFTFAGLCAPVFDWWWTPRWRVLFFVLMVDVLLVLVAGPLLCWSALRANKASADASTRRGRLAPFAWIAGILLLAGTATALCTRSTCVQLYGQGDYHLGLGDQRSARECYEAAARWCLADGHDPAH